jgi:hypothetical protein
LAAKHLADIDGELTIEIVQVGPAGVQGKVERCSSVGLRGRKAHAITSWTNALTVTPTEAEAANFLKRSSAVIASGPMEVSVMLTTSQPTYLCNTLNTVQLHT